MIENLPNWIEWLFVLTSVLTIGLFHFANGKPNQLTFLIIIWSVGQSILAYTGFYQKTEVIPPRFLLVLIPILVFTIFGLTKKRRNWIVQNRLTEASTFLHTIRLPIEIILYYLFLNNMMPELMTFDGRNFDIFAGLTAPIIGILWLKKIIGRTTLIVWNVIGLFLILFVFANGILSSELPIQMFGFEQPTTAPNYFPFVLLPATIVPIVIYTHLTDIIKLWSKNRL
ncbi:MAG: hypothetical protein ACFB0A_13190 [Croceivirga sp.]